MFRRELPENPLRMQAWLGRVTPVATSVSKSTSTKAARRKKASKAAHVKAVKGSRTLGMWLKGNTLSGHRDGILVNDYHIGPAGNAEGRTSQMISPASTPNFNCGEG